MLLVVGFQYEMGGMEGPLAYLASDSSMVLEVSKRLGIDATTCWLVLAKWRCTICCG